MLVYVVYDDGYLMWLDEVWSFLFFFCKVVLGGNCSNYYFFV